MTPSVQYDLVRLEDGTIGFARNALDAEISRAIAEAIEELFGPEPAADVELPDVFKG